MNGLLLRAIFAFCVLPGMVAFVIPLAVIGAGRGDAFVDPWALIPLGFGTVLLLWCVREFYAAGRGTLAPWAPPRHLVVTGPYRWSRNAMYVAVLLVISAWAQGFRAWPLGVYAVAMMIAFHLRVVLYEEPWLARTHGAAWTDYQARVPRWFGVRAPAVARKQRGETAR